MKKLAALLLGVAISLGAYAKDIKEVVFTTNPPMSCQNCENKIKGNLRFEKGVKDIRTELSDQRVIVKYDADKTSPEKIEEGFKKIGYNVQIIEVESGTPASAD